MKPLRLAALSAIAALIAPNALAQDSLSLAGPWHVSAQGIDTNIELPGSLMERRLGETPSVRTQWVATLYDSSFFFNPRTAEFRQDGNLSLPFFLTPPAYFVGKATYVRTVDIPKDWKGRHVSLFLERAHITTSVRINGKTAGSFNSLNTPHVFDVSRLLAPGKKNTIEIIVDNDPSTVGVGADSHSISDQTQGCWNGLTGKLQLIATKKPAVLSIDVFPDADKHKASVRLKLSDKAKGVTLKAELFNSNLSQTISRHYDLAADSATLLLDLGPDAHLWSDKDPALYRLTATVDGSGTTANTSFGLRSFKTKGKMFFLNDKLTMLRGTVENCCFPLTGYPPTDVQSWKKLMKTIKSFGLNHVRFHSYCPPEAAFIAADEVGILIQAEGPSWPNHGVSLGRGEMVDQYLLDETQRMADAYGNHPSYVMLAAGNEPRGRWVEWCTNFVDSWEKKDSRRLYTGASVGGGWQWQPRSQFHVKAGARGLTWDKKRPSSTDDFANAIASFHDKATGKDFIIDRPFVTHEMGQWCAFPDLDETDQYTGVYKAKNMDIFRKFLEQGGMANLSHHFLISSGKLQSLCYKYEIERLLRTPDYAGFQLLALNDYSGQGTATVGLLNVFFREKGYCNAQDFREFCADAVPLAKFAKFTFSSDEKATADIDIANFTGHDISGTLTAAFTDHDGNTLATHSFHANNIPQGSSHSGWTLNLPLEKASSKPLKITLRISGPDGMNNHWDFWAYPAKQPQPNHDDIYITNSLDKQALKTLQDGGKVLICAAGKISYGKDVVQTFTPVFWNTSWFKMRPPHTTGSYIRSNHPIFDNFPTDDFTNINWWELVNRTQTMLLDDFPKDFQPIVQPIDTWFVSRKLATLFEAKVLNGKLIMTTFDLDSNPDDRPAARQMKTAILNYMDSPLFFPEQQVSPDRIADLFNKVAPPVDLFTNDSPDELKPKFN